MNPGASSGFASAQEDTMEKPVGGVDARVIDQSHGNTLHAYSGANVEISYGAQKTLNSQSTPGEQLPPLPRCPAPCTGYVRRKRLEAHMSSYFFGLREDGHRRKRYVLHGLGGSGKTQAASNFINDNCYNPEPGQRRFLEAYWVDATSEGTIKKSLRDIARSAGRSTYEDALVLLASHNAKSNWVMVYNNADDPSIDLSQYFPNCTHGNIIITTRNFQATRYGEGPGSDYAVSGMDHDEARELFITQARLFDASPSTIQTVDKLVEELNYFPLSIRQSGTYAFTTSCTPAEYINDLRTRQKELLRKHDETNPEAYKYGTMEAALSLSVAQLSPGAQWLLQLFAWLHGESILEKIIQDGLSGLRSYKRKYRRLASKEERATIFSMNQFREELISAGRWDINKFRKFIDEIKSFSLVIYDSERRAYSIHPLVQKWTRSAVDKTIQRLLSQSAILLLASAIAANRTNTTEELPFLISLAPHVDEVLKCEISVFDGCKNEFGYVYRGVGRWHDEKKLREKYNEICQRVLGKKHPKTLFSIKNVAWTFFCLGYHEAAAETQSKLLEIEKVELGMSHPYTLGSMNNLAGIYHYQGKYSTAAKLHTEALEIKKVQFGPEHPSTLISMNNLASTYASQRKFRKAAKIQSKVLEIEKVKFGVDHPDTLISMHNLANTYLHQAKFKKAAEMQSKVFEMRKMKLGEGHPHTLTSASNLAMIYLWQLKIKKAAEIQFWVVEMEKARFGVAHPEMPVPVSILAAFNLCQGRCIKAAKIFSVVLQACKRHRRTHVDQLVHEYQLRMCSATARLPARHIP